MNCPQIADRDFVEIHFDVPPRINLAMWRKKREPRLQYASPNG